MLSVGEVKNAEVGTCKRYRVAERLRRGVDLWEVLESER